MLDCLSEHWGQGWERSSFIWKSRSKPSVHQPRIYLPAWSLPASSGHILLEAIANTDIHLPTCPPTHISAYLPMHRASLFTIYCSLLPAVSPLIFHPPICQCSHASIQIFKWPSLIHPLTHPAHSRTHPTSSSPIYPSTPSLSPSHPYEEPIMCQAFLYQSQPIGAQANPEPVSWPRSVRHC